MVSHRPSRLCFSILTLTVVLSGCALTPGGFQLGRRNTPAHGDEAALRRAGSPARPENGAATPSDVQAVYLTFDLVVAEFTVDDVRHSQKVWNHVNQQRLDADVSARLARNGVRVGVASADAWPIFKAIFDAGEASVERRRLATSPSEPLTLDMALVEPGESIFSYSADRRLVGKTFDGGVKVVVVDYSFHPEWGSATELRLGFEVRRLRDELSWEKHGTEITQRAAVDRYVFDQLASHVRVRPGEFLVLGASENFGLEYLVGSRFLTARSSGERREKIFCITPVPIEASRLHGAASGTRDRVGSTRLARHGQ